MRTSLGFAESAIQHSASGTVGRVGERTCTGVGGRHLQSLHPFAGLGVMTEREWMNSTDVNSMEG